MASLTEIRAAAEAAFEADQTDENLRALIVAGKAEMDWYLKGFDARHVPDPRKAAQDAIRERIMQDRTSRLRSGTDPLQTAYHRYASEGMEADRDFTPLDFEAWKEFMTTTLPSTQDHRTQGISLRPKAPVYYPITGDPRTRHRPMR